MRDNIYIIHNFYIICIIFAWKLFRRHFTLKISANYFYKFYTLRKFIRYNPHVIILKPNTTSKTDVMSSVAYENKMYDLFSLR